MDSAQSVIPMPYRQSQIEALMSRQHEEKIGSRLEIVRIEAGYIQLESALGLELFELSFVEFALDLKLSEIGSELGIAVKLFKFVEN
ncbi:6927_t:CDS:2 [Dentiscutata erythropus]|uniref:6927_t:CDS:1 n=1 Tax=Dentiscutata erythropus TaxID=1348616 RepID=A0A9N9E420_9GLOM|nr:6927_t:CDS:2 [Dentiscutata erythropus]